jgi:type II secretory pathway pseudopilin PulG
LWQRLRANEGFGLVELLMAMTILNVGILAIVAAFNAGAFAVFRASRTSTAASVADRQMELYRSLPWASIGLDSTALGTVDNTYKCDATLGASCPNSTSSETTVVSCSGSSAPQCVPTQSPVIGADRHRYRIDTYITTTTPTGGRPVRVVTVVVRDANNLSAHPYVREASTFDQSFG